MQTRNDIKVEYVEIGNLKSDPANPRFINNQELEALTRSIREFGLVDPIIARHEDKMVIGGHQRLLAARKLGYTTVPGSVCGYVSRTGPFAKPRPQQDIRFLRPRTSSQTS